MTTLNELDILFEINRVINKTEDWKAALDQIVQIIRSIFIFDNLVLYLPEPGNGIMEAVYARAVGRGKSVGTDISWGETVINQVMSTGELCLQEPQNLPTSKDNNRLEQPYVLGVPLEFKKQILGILVLIRFGGPIFDQKSIRLTEFIGDEIAHLLERRHLQSVLSFLQREYQQSQHQEDFITTISHELLTPLGFIKGYATTLLRSDTNWDENTRREFLTIIDQETDRLQELIDNILDSSRLQSGTLPMDFQPVRMDVLVKDVIVRAQMQHIGLIVHIFTETQIRPIQGDPRRLAQVIENLLNNAIKYAPHSTIAVTIKEVDSEIVIAFQDTGPGIPAQYLPHLFGKFFRNPEQSVTLRGTGLGLYICRQIIKAHHGSISVNSTVGKGTTVFIHLPGGQEVANSDDSHQEIAKEELNDTHPGS